MDRTRALVLIGFGICSLAAAADSTAAAPQAIDKLQVSNTERSDFPSGGLLNLKNSIGELTIEGWDQPGLEITTIKSSKTPVEGKERDKASKILDGVKISTERKGDEITISTDFYKRPKIERPFLGMVDFDLEYRIKVPRNARLTISHNMGEIHIDGVSGEVHAINETGLITVRLPGGQYAIDAKSKVGAVDSDFPGSEKSEKWLGHTFAGTAPGNPQKLFLRMGYGDIILSRMNQPSAPAPAIVGGK